MTTTELQEAVAAEKELAGRLHEFEGQWVAVRNHRVVEHADTLKALLDRVGSQLDEIDRIFEVGENTGGLCFF